MQTLLAFFHPPPPHPFVPSRSFSPLSSPHPRLFRFSFIQRPTRAPSLSILRFLSRDAAAAFRAFLSFPFRVFPAPLFPLLFSSREFLTRPFRAPLIPVSFEPEMESSWFIPSFRIPFHHPPCLFSIGITSN